jgi:hypothetical protein
VVVFAGHPAAVAGQDSAGGGELADLAVAGGEPLAGGGHLLGCACGGTDAVVQGLQCGGVQADRGGRGLVHGVDGLGVAGHTGGLSGHPGQQGGVVLGLELARRGDQRLPRRRYGRLQGFFVRGRRSPNRVSA